MTTDKKVRVVANDKKNRGVFFRDDAWWIRYADSTGRIRREKVGTKSAAIQLYAKRKTEVRQGTKLPENIRTKAVTFAELAERTLEYSKAHKLSHSDDACRMRRLTEDFGSRSADAITPQDIERWLTDAADEHDWSPATINRYKALFSLVFRLGMENGKIKTNPARLVKGRRENNARIRWLSAEEEKAIRAVIEREYPEHLEEFEIALNSGMRSGEQYSLTWKDIDYTTRNITVGRSKNGENRHIPMNRSAVMAFKSLFDRSQGTGYVFVNLRGERIVKARYWFGSVIAKAHVADFTWHCLRHTFASRLVMAGVDLRTVQQLMGHKTIQMTTRYSHLAPEHQLAAVERLCDTSGAPDGATDTTTDTCTKTDLPGSAPRIH